jgi:tagaturonate reductase
VKRLNRALLSDPTWRPDPELQLPSPPLFDLPEKVLQFGTGVFLRAFVDFFVDQANRRSIFNGRVVVVQSTGSGTAKTLNEQDGLFTLVSRGLDKDHPVEHVQVVSSISRAISANERWEEVLAVAASPELQVVVSNTTESGIALDPEEDLHASPPKSFPGKLTACLLHRFRAFEGDPQKGLLIIPCELIDDNATVLRSIVLTLIDRFQLGEKFKSWVAHHNRFCNSLVDRIVTGRPDEKELLRWQERLGYLDDLLEVAEVFHLWAIEGEESSVFPLHEIDTGVVFAHDISTYHELKLHLLNGPHTAMVPVGLLLGVRTVREAVEHPEIGPFLRQLMVREIVPALSVPTDVAQQYADSVWQRFRNPFLDHELKAISKNASTKWRTRLLPVVRAYQEKRGAVPQALAFAFACQLLFTCGSRSQGPTAGEVRRNDPHAEIQQRTWKSADNSDEGLRAVLARREIWGQDLGALPGWPEEVGAFLRQIEEAGPLPALQAFLSKSE